MHIPNADCKIGRVFETFPMSSSRFLSQFLKERTLFLALAEACNSPFQLFSKSGPPVQIHRRQNRMTSRAAVLRKNAVWTFQSCHISSDKMFTVEENYQYFSEIFSDFLDQITSKITWKMEEKSGCLLKQADQNSVLLQYLFSTFPKISVLFQYLHLTKFGKFQ